MHELDERLNGLLLRHRGRTGLTQRELAARVGVHIRSVQDWEGGINCPSAERLQLLIAAFFEAGGFTSGREADEAETLWDAALRDAPRMRTPFDSFWFAHLLAGEAKNDEAVRRQEVPIGSPVPRDECWRRQDWGGSPDVLGFVGRVEELAILSEWLLEERCRVLAIVGMGGVGKTTLASQLARQVAPRFERVYWRSMRDAVPVGEWIAEAISFLSCEQIIAPACDGARLATLLQLLRERRTLLVLDNLEALLEPGDRAGSYRHEYAGYGRLVRAIGDARHQSSLLLTSREVPSELLVLDGAARMLKLGGFGVLESQALLAHKELYGTATDWARLSAAVGGNGLVLKMVGESIRQVCAGDIGAFLAESGSPVQHGGMRRLLAQQIDRGSTLEKQVLKWMASIRKPVTLAALMAELGPRVGRGAVLEGVEALRRRSLLEREERDGVLAFRLPRVVLEYVSDHQVEDAARLSSADLIESAA